MIHEQLPLDGIEPARMKRSRPPHPEHLPTIEDAEALRRWVREETQLPGVLKAKLDALPTEVHKLVLLKTTKRKFVMTTRGRDRVLALADRWEKAALKRGGS